MAQVTDRVAARKAGAALRCGNDSGIAVYYCRKSHLESIGR